MKNRLSKLLSAHLGPSGEQEFLDILSALEPEELNGALHELNIPRLLSEMDDHWLGKKNNQILLQLLTVERLSDLDLESRCALLLAFQRGWTPIDQEFGIRNIFLGTSGSELFRLKQMLETGRAYRDLHNLVYHDLDDHQLRKEILDHFSLNATSKGPLKILSDIDDTVYVNWKDEKYRKKTIYPGVLRLYSALDRGVDGKSRGDLTFITARPKEPTKLAIKHAIKTLKSFGITHPVILPGRLHQFFTSATILERKWKNFIQYRKLYPEREFIFIGDSGQGDADLALRMLKKKGISLALIHRIQPFRSVEWVQAHQMEGLHFFDNYIEAAGVLWENKLLSLEDTRSVMESALKESEQLPGRRARIRHQELLISAEALENKLEK